MGKNLSFVLNNLEDLVAAFFISITTILVVINIVLRYVFNSGLVWSEEAVTLALISLLRECPKVCRRLSA